MEIVDFLYNAVVVLHFVGLASLLGGFLVQMRSSEKGVNPAMLHGAITQLVTGIIMQGMLESGAVGDGEVLTWKLATKLGITVVVTVLAFLGRLRTGPQVGYWAAIGGLTLINVILAVFWS